MKKTFLFLTPDGVTYSSPDKFYPDVENMQVLGYEEGKNEEEALKKFIQKNKWIFKTDFREVVCIEVKTNIEKSKKLFLTDFYSEI